MSTIPNRQYSLSGRACGVLAAVGLLLVYLIYRPGLAGPLLLDDFSTLVALGSDGGIQGWRDAMRFVFTNTSGPSGRPVSMASFLVDGRDWPVDATAFKHTNVLLHMATGVCVGWFCRLLLEALQVPRQRAAILALLVALLWLLHPLNVSTTLYVVQRMTQLMALFSLLALICYMKGMSLMVERPLAGLAWLCVALCPFGLLAVLSKENGALLLAAILVVELTVFADRDYGPLHRWWLRILVVAPLCLTGVYLALSMETLTADFAYRSFTLAERLMTQGRVLTGYLLDMVVPRTGSFGLFQDDRVISRGLFEPWTTLPCIGLLLAAITLAIRWRRAQPALAFSIGWFFSWHLLESSFLPLEPYFEHRNYLPLVGVLLGLVYHADRLLASRPLRAARTVSLCATLAVLVVFAGLTLLQTRLWGNTGNLLQHWAERHPASSRAQLVYGDALAAARDIDAAYGRIEQAAAIHPREITLLLHAWNFACEYGRQPERSLAQLAAMQDLEYFRDDINFQVRRLVEALVAQRCPFPPGEQVIGFMNRLAMLPMRDFDRANFHFLFSDVYVYYRQLTPALVELRKVFDLRPGVEIPIRQAILAASAGNYQDSLAFLERARLADQSRGWLIPSRLDEITDMERDIQSLADTN